MDVNKVKSDIKTGNFDRFYIFGVEEGYVAKTYINKIAGKTGYNLEYANSVNDIYPKLKVKSIIPVHTVYVVIDDKEFLNSKYESRWDLIENNIQDDILILMYTHIDKRVKFWKHFKEKAVIFEKLPERLLVRYIQKQVKLSEDNCKLLIEVCESDLNRILSEVNKLKHHMQATKSEDVPNNEFELLLFDGTIYRPPKDAIFDFVNAVLQRDINKSYELLEDCKAVGEANMVLISVLYTNFRNVLQVQSCNGQNVSKSTGLTGWQIRNVSPYKDVYDDERITDILLMLREVEKSIKTGTITDDISVEYALAHIFKKGV